MLLVASCATLPPQFVNFLQEEVHYISPLNGDGIQGAMSVPIGIELLLKGVLRGYAFSVSDSNGTVVRLIHDEIANPGFFKRITNAIAPGKRASIEPPELILWDGRNDTAEFVEDGNYSVVLDVWDYSNRRISTAPVAVIVDNTPPVIDLSVPNRMFSPNGDGNKDTLPIAQTGSNEESWVAQIIAGDNTVVAEMI